MYATKSKTSRIFALAMAILMALTVTVGSAFAEIRPFNVDTTTVSASMSYANSKFTVSAVAPNGTTQIKVDATLYQKNGNSYTRVDSASYSINSDTLIKTHSYNFSSGKSYKLTVLFQICTNGQWDTINRTYTASF